MKDENSEKVNNAGNPLYLIFIFIVIIGFIVYIPEFYEKYNKEKASLYGIGSKTEITEKNKEDKLTNKLSDHFRKEDSTTFENITFSNIQINGDILTIDLTNHSKENIDMKEKSYYIEFYRTENNQRFFVNRRILKSEETIEPQQKITLSVNINGITIDDAVTFAIARVDDEAAPTVKLENNMLTCTKDNTTYVYTFEDENLVKTEYKITLIKDANLLNTYREKEKGFNSLNGLTASIVETDANFTFTSTFDYKVISKYKVDIDYIYDSSYKANAISFRTTAEGFDCK